MLLPNGNRPTSDEGMRARLALAIILLIALIVAVLLFFEIPVGNRDLVNVSLGVLLANLKDVYNFSFGDSAGRTRQADTLNKVAAVAAASATPTDSLTLQPGDQASVTPAPDGTTTVSKDPT